MPAPNCVACEARCRDGRSAHSISAASLQRLMTLGYRADQLAGQVLCGSCHRRLQVGSMSASHVMHPTNSWSLSVAGAQRDQLPSRPSEATVFSAAGVRKEVQAVLQQVEKSAQKLGKSMDETLLAVAQSRAAGKLMPAAASALVGFPLANEQKAAPSVPVPAPVVRLPSDLALPLATHFAYRCVQAAPVMIDQGATDMLVDEEKAAPVVRLLLRPGAVSFLLMVLAGTTHKCQLSETPGSARRARRTNER
jgi:hypothetical protein